MSTSWSISIDWDRNGNFSGSYDDVTDKTLSVNWFLGFRQSYQHVADNSGLVLVLDNSDQRFTPENGVGQLSGKVRPFKPIRIQSNDGTTVRTHWTGWIEKIHPSVGKFGERQVRILANGPAPLYIAAEANMELQENQRTDQIVEKLVELVTMPPFMATPWTLGQAGKSNVNSMTVADTHAILVKENGLLTLAIAADNWVKRGGPTDVSQDVFDVYRAIGDLTAAERGRFFFDREGNAVFWNRHHFLTAPEPGDPTPPVLDDSMTDMAYTYAGLEQIRNEVLVVCHPRVLSPTADEVLWDLGEAIIRVEKGKKRIVYLKFQDDDGNRLGGKDLTINDLTFENPAVTAVATLKEKATGTELLLDNTAGSADAIVTKLTIKGRKITDYDQMETRAADTGSVVDYGRRTLRINLPSIDRLDRADSIAKFELDRRKTPRGEVNSVTLKSHGQRGGGHHAEQLALTIGDRVTVEETQTAHASTYFVIGEAHELTSGANLLQTTWYLEPVPAVYPWKLGQSGYSNLGASTLITY